MENAEKMRFHKGLVGLDEKILKKDFRETLKKFLQW
jgi:hypothetical protein